MRASLWFAVTVGFLAMFVGNCSAWYIRNIGINYPQYVENGDGLVEVRTVEERIAFGIPAIPVAKIYRVNLVRGGTVTRSFSGKVDFVIFVPGDIREYFLEYSCDIDGFLSEKRYVPGTFAQFMSPASDYSYLYLTITISRALPALRRQ